MFYVDNYLHRKNKNCQALRAGMAKPIILIFGNSLRVQTTTCTRKLVSIGKVMTSLRLFKINYILNSKVITFGIGQSAGKFPKSVMVRIWKSLNDVESGIYITSRVFYL